MTTTENHEDGRTLGKLMLMMRRLVREEFTVTIHLDDQEATEELLAFASRSRNTLLRQMARELGELLSRGALHQEQPAAEKKEGPSDKPKRVYRGQVIS